MVFSKAGGEKGILAGIMGDHAMYYCFYPKSTLKNGRTEGVVSPYVFQPEQIRDPNCDRNIVKFKLLGNEEYTLTFAKDIDAIAFLG